MTRRFSFWTLADAALFAASLWLVRDIPIAFIGGTYDDLLFAREANSLLDGQWLGPFDQLTLSKGCVYPLFLALAAMLHVPVMVATQTVYLCGSLFLSRIATTLSGYRAAGTLCFAILAASPVLLDGSSSMLMREGLYAGLTMLTLALAARALLFPQRNVLWGIAAGLALGAFWMTREEGIWLLPALGLLVLHRVFLQRRLLVLPVMALPFLATLLTVASINHAAYGVFRLNDFQSGPFPAAYAALSRIEHDHWQRLIPVPADARAHAYSVSPSALLLKPSLEGASGQNWTQIGCQNNPIPDCHDIQAGWFVWALRDAVTAAGKYVTARDADRFYRGMTREIDHACEAGQIACTATPHGYLPPFQHIDVAVVLRNVLDIAWHFAELGSPRPGWAMPTLVREKLLAQYRRITPGTIETPAFSFDTVPAWTLQGGFAAAVPGVAIAVVAAPGSIAQSDLHMAPIVDVQGAVTVQRFSGDAHCAFAACSLVVTCYGRTIAAWPMASLAPGTILDRPGLRVVLERIAPLPLRPLIQPSGARTDLAMALAKWGARASLIGFPAALLWCVWRCVRHTSHPLTALALSIVVTIATRIALLAIVDATSIPNQFRYEEPGLVLVPALIALMLTNLLSRLRERKRPSAKHWEGGGPHP